MALRTSSSFSGTKSFTNGPPSGGLTGTPTRLYSSVPGVSAVYSGSVPVSPRAPMNAADEIRSLRAHNEALQKQLTLKDQGLERLRQKVQERALMLSHEKAADVQQTRREAGTVIEDLEAENCKLRSDLAHRTSQLHSAVTRIAALKSRMDDLILRNDELMAVRDRRQRSAVAARKRKAVIAQKAAGHSAQKDAMATVLGTQDTILNLIENLSFLPPKQEEEEAGYSPSGLRQAASARASLTKPPPPPTAAPPQPQPQPQAQPQSRAPQAPVARSRPAAATIAPSAAATVAPSIVAVASTPIVRISTPNTSTTPHSAATQVAPAGSPASDVLATPLAAGFSSTGSASAAPLRQHELTSAEAATGGGGGGGGPTVAGRAHNSAWDEYSVSAATVGTQQPSTGVLDAARAGWRAGGGGPKPTLYASAAHNARYEAAHLRLARFEQKFGQPSASGSQDEFWKQPPP